MQVEWTEGEWKDGCPVEPEGSDHVWVFVERKHGYPHCTTADHVPFYVRTMALAMRRNADDENLQPRWWWAPLEEPSNLPVGCERDE